MDYKNAVEIRNLKKKFKNFELDIPELNIPAGYATALIGENGAGKSTLLNILSGIRLDYKGNLRFFGKNETSARKPEQEEKSRIGYTGTENYFLPGWTVGQVEEISKLLFDDFDVDVFRKYCDDMAIFGEKSFISKKTVGSLSDGTKTKLMLACVLARKTDMLILDEPASPLDPLMRDKLCELIGNYLAEDENRSVFFSTHNIGDMENITDYAIIMAHGKIAEQGAVDDLKEKYILVKGEPKDAEAAAKFMFSMTKTRYGFEGICLTENIDKLAGMDITTEIPSLFDISVAVMKSSSLVK